MGRKGGWEGTEGKEEIIITHLRIRHTGPNGKCDYCGMSESVQHVMIEHRGYEKERSQLKAAVEKAKINFNLGNLHRIESQAMIIHNGIYFIYV